MAKAISEDIISRREAIAKSQPSETGSTERVRRLNAKLLHTPHTICLHRARAYTKIFSETEGEPTPLRFAKGYAQTLNDLPVYINEGELIVGEPRCRIRSGNFVPEAIAAWFEKDLEQLATREWDPYDVSPEQIKEAREIISYWHGKTVFDLWSKACPPEIVGKVIGGSGWADSSLAVYSSGFHFCPPFEMVLSNGLSWYEARAREAYGKIDPLNPEQMGKDHFYQALLIVVDAIKNYIGRYSQKARELAGNEPDSKRKKELLRISEMIARVPYYGARTFHEAVQSIWFTCMLEHIEGSGPVQAEMGRIDQYLYPYYEADIKKGILTTQEAQELLELLFIKLNSPLRIYGTEAAKVTPGYTYPHLVCVGGVDAAGKDASNELSYLILEASASVRTISPDIALLCHPRETPYKLKMKGAELNALGLGVPKLLNTEAIKTQLMNQGYSPEEARAGWIHGCTEPYGPGCQQYGHSAGCMINLPLALEAVLFNGRKRMPGQHRSGDLIGVETGDPRQFSSFDDFMGAVKTQIARQIRDGHVACSWVEWVQSQYFPTLLQSLFTEACIERGVSVQAGGAKINVGPGVVPGGGLGTVADSLAAVKKLVYEEKKISMDELLKAIDANFEGHENTRQMLLNHAPKFGNDIDYVDNLAVEIFRFINAETRSYITPLGNRNVASTCRPMSHVPAGTRVWATPDGRKAGMPFSNHVGPTDGMDVNGPAANINSVTKLEMDAHWGAVHNLYLVNVDNEEKLHNMVDLIDLFLSRGGHHVQINCQDKAVFVDAQKHPEKYRGLRIRVAGYVAYFVELPKSIQDQIILRTSHYV